MMRKLSYLLTLAATLFIAACGDSGGFVDDDAGNPPGPGGDVTVSVVNVLSSSPSLPSDAGQTVDLMVVVRDDSNVAVGGVTVLLSSDSGILTILEPVTNISGVMTATLNAGGDPTNRPITITADANGVLGTTIIDVIGTTLSISGAPALAQGDSSVYTIVLTDAGGNGISNQTVDVTSATGNTLAASSLMTDTGGQAQVQVTASAAGADTLTATTLSITATTPLDVSDDSFSLTAPLPGTEVLLNTASPVSLSWSIGGTAQANETISFSATRGTLAQSSVQTDAAGVASTTISSNNAGAAVITATNALGTSTSAPIEFVASVPTQIAVQASPFTIGPAEQSAVTATLRDAAGNLVKNIIVQFVLDDVTGGQLSVAQSITDSQGRAQTFYTSSSSTSANNGVVITASVQSDPLINAEVSLTVAQRELFISIGTGNTIFEPNSAQYRKEYAVQITDSQGNGVSGVDVQIGILSDYYGKGFWFFPDGGQAWQQEVTIVCMDEDSDPLSPDSRNGILDPGEDNNDSGRIEAGNIATATPQNGNPNGSFTSDASGFGIIDVIYPQEHARWVQVTLEATTAVQGTEFARNSKFWLAINAEDTSDENVEPPGRISPFGILPDCTNLD